ncbi:V-type ATPase subunit [Candidatus Kaiserbacteria bacterium]|nr:V-type ATPase subunit [Candidatus Kaiserbacteria bacterium]MCB9812695.1 V-type ATPase subunit [Candidatus Nomurabacteria bacterium]
MQTSYIYSASRVNALTQFLLSKTDIERLLVADPGEELQSALKETYLAPYVVRVPDESVPLAIEQTLIDAKRLIHRITPQGDMFRIMWVQYDIHNLRVFAKARVAGLTYEACDPYLSKRGIYEPDYLFKHVENDSLDFLQPEWQAGFARAVESAKDGDLGRIDSVLDDLYFITAKRIVATLGDDFMKRYLATLIDLYNLKSRLRHLTNTEVSFTPAFVEGGSFVAEHIETLEDTLALFHRFGGEGFWKDALQYFTETGNFTRIDARAAEYLLITAKEGSYDMFSSASLVLYYLKCRQAAANVRTIVVGKNNGLSLEDIRTNLRMAYVND